jgi:pimeloyl-ACP methyl ester carboxylesterase
MERMMLEDGNRRVALEVLVEGTGPDVVLVPSALRGAEDFGLLQAGLSDAGYRSVAMNPRGAGRSTAEVDTLTLRDIADDVAFVVSELCGGRAHLVGHALGNILVRATASYRPEVVATVTGMPCGGQYLDSHPVAPEVRAAMGRCHDGSLPEQDRIAALEVAFFAAGNDASVWLDGWWPTADVNLTALEGTDPEEWWRAGTAPILVIQPLEDAMVAVEVGRMVASELGARATYREIPNCGHAALPEQPDVIARYIIDFLRGHP